jgi:hypothetical protein
VFATARNPQSRLKKSPGPEGLHTRGHKDSHSVRARTGARPGGVPAARRHPPRSTPSEGCAHGRSKRSQSGSSARQRIETPAPLQGHSPCTLVPLRVMLLPRCYRSDQKTPERLKRTQRTPCPGFFERARAGTTGAGGRDSLEGLVGEHPWGFESPSSHFLAPQKTPRATQNTAPHIKRRAPRSPVSAPGTRSRLLPLAGEENLAAPLGLEWIRALAVHGHF